MWMWTTRTKVAAALLAATALACAVGGAWLYRTGFTKGAASVRAEWDAERAAQLAALAEQQMKARQREKALTDALEQQRLERRREVDRIVREHQRIVDGLRNRPEARASDGGVPEGAAAGVGCTGQGLARGDAEFLAGYSADAARLQSALNACQAAYDEVRRALNGGS